MLSIAPTLTTALVYLACAAAGAYFGAYLRKSGENAATNENLKDLLAQTRAITDATKSIEARISDEVWDRQRQWELKRDALLSGVEALGHADEALLEMVLIILKCRENQAHLTDLLIAKRDSNLDEWQRRIKAYDGKRRTVSLVCRKETSHAFHVAGNEIRVGASRIFQNKATSFEGIMPPIQQAIVRAFEAARNELGIKDSGEIDTRAIVEPRLRDETSER
jgi:hypothetical protein